jgi:ribosomal protein L11 methyltransferase
MLASLWRLELRVALNDAAVFSEVLENIAVAVSWDTPDGACQATLHAYFSTEPDIVQVRVALADAAEALNTAMPVTDILWLPPRDWLAANREDFPPLDVGRFHVRGSHQEGRPPAGLIVICLDAATAFGSGRHATTAGCLLAVQDIARRRNPKRVLDMGCGSGILAIAMARLWPGSNVTSADVDAEAVRVTAENAHRNGVALRIIPVVSNGYRASTVRASAPYDVIVANILANPLKKMASDLACALAPGGLAVLSGLLLRDAPAVLAAHRSCGLHLVSRIVIDDWATLTISKGVKMVGTAGIEPATPRV